MIKVKTLTGKEIEIDIEPQIQSSESRNAWKKKKASPLSNKGNLMGHTSRA